MTEYHPDVIAAIVAAKLRDERWVALPRATCTWGVFDIDHEEFIGLVYEFKPDAEARAALRNRVARAMANR